MGEEKNHDQDRGMIKDLVLAAIVSAIIGNRVKPRRSRRGCNRLWLTSLCKPSAFHPLAG